jgi:hypothetical protein
MTQLLKFVILGVVVCSASPVRALEVKDILALCQPGVSKEDSGACTGYFMGLADERLATGMSRQKNKDCTIGLPYSKIKEQLLLELTLIKDKTEGAGFASNRIMNKLWPCKKVDYLE